MFRRPRVIWFIVAACLVWATSTTGCSEDPESTGSDAELTHDAAHDPSDVASDEDGSSGGDDATDTGEDDDTASSDSGVDAGGCPDGDGTFEVLAVEGTLADGAQISVCGDLFGDLGPDILLFDDMEAGEAGEAVPTSAPIIGEWLGGSTVYAGDAARSGSLSMVVADSTINGGAGRGMVVGNLADDEELGMEVFDEFFVSWAIRDLGDFPGNNSSPTDFSTDSSAKDIWVMYGDRGDNYDYSCSQGTCNGNDLVLMTHTGSGSFKTDGNTTSSDWWHGDFWQFQEWNSMSLHLRIDQDQPYTASQGVIEHTSPQGGFVTETYDGQIFKQLDGVPTVWDRLKFGAWYRRAGEVRRVMDDLYVATGPGAAARVEVANAPRIENASKIAVSTVDDWSNQRLEATVRLGNLDPDSDSLYLFVVNANNERTAGFPISDGDDDAGGDDENLLFADDFSSGDMSKHNEFFRWTQGDVPPPGSGSGRVVTVEGPDGTEVQARRFRYVGIDDGGSGDAAHFSEQRFALTQSVSEERSRNAPSDVAYPEVWISYWMYVPDNYHHNLKDGTISGSNQKGWIYLWKDRYEKWQDSVPDAEVTPTTASLHWWPLTEDENSDNFGMTRASLVATRGRNGWGHDGNASFIRDQEQVPDSTRNFAFLESEYGTWVHYTFGMKVASDAQSDDGFVRIYKNGELALAWENEGNGSDDPDTNGFDRGYLMGYHNAVYTQTTTYFITDFKFGLTPDAVMN